MNKPLVQPPRYVCNTALYPNLHSIDDICTYCLHICNMNMYEQCMKIKVGEGKRQVVKNTANMSGCVAQVVG